MIFTCVFLFCCCAIHKKSPFICFRRGCVKEALGINQLKAFKKNIRGKAQIRRNRANAKLNLKNKKRKTKHTSYSDSISIGNISAQSCELIKMVFFKLRKINQPPTDTFLVHFRQPEDEIDELSEIQIRGYLLKIDLNQLSKIKLCYCTNSEKKNELSRGLYLQRSKKITRLLKDKGISKQKIELE